MAICHPITHLKINLNHLRINHPLMNNLPQTNPPAHPLNLNLQRNPHLHRTIINHLKRPLMTNLPLRLIKCHLNRIIKFLPLLHLIKVVAVMIKVVAVEVVMNTGAIIATGVNGASAHKTALVPKPALVQFWDHPMDPSIAPKLRSHSHAILMFAHKWQISNHYKFIYLNEILSIIINQCY